MSQLGIKERVFSRIDSNREKLLERSRALFNCPELGYREFQTGAFIKEQLKSWGVPWEPLSYTGLQVTLGQGKPVLAALFDMDALPKKDGMGCIHSCGHSLQTAAGLGLIEALKDEPLSCTLRVIFTPAEEMIDFAYRESLIKEGRITSPSGKQDMIVTGVFDNVDAVLSCHANGDSGTLFDIGSTLTGFVIVRAFYTGRSSHAGFAPFLGKNALHGACLAQNAIAFLKDQFDPKVCINVQPVLTELQGSINTVPAGAKLETYVRGLEKGSLLEAAGKVKNCMERCGEALGLETRVEVSPGFLPLKQSEAINKIVEENMLLLCGPEAIVHNPVSGASGDVGDLSALLPTVQFGFSGVRGRFHSDDFAVIDEENACVRTVKVLCGTVLSLQSFPPFDRAEYEKQKAFYLENWFPGTKVSRE